MEHAIRVLAALLTPTIALLAVFIGIRQYHVSRLTLREKLFDRRAAVLEAISEFIQSVSPSSGIDMEKLYALTERTRYGDLLFGPTIAHYVRKLYTKAVELRTCELILEARNTGQQEREKRAEQKEELILWFYDQSDIARSVFADQISLVFESPLSGPRRLSIALSVVWLVGFTIFYFVVLYWIKPYYSHPLWFLYEGHLPIGIEPTAGNYVRFAEPRMAWEVFLSWLFVPVLLPWAVWVIIKSVRWVKTGFVRGKPLKTSPTKAKKA